MALGLFLGAAISALAVVPASAVVSSTHSVSAVHLGPIRAMSGSGGGMTAPLRGASRANNAITGTISGKPTAQARSYTVNITVTDPGGATGTVSFTLRVVST